MSTLDPDLLNITDIVPIMDDLFSYNEKLVLLIDKNIETLTKKDPNGVKIFKTSLNETYLISILNIVNYAKQIRELRGDAFIEVKKGHINNSLVNKFKQLNNKFKELMYGYMPLLQAFRNTLKLTKEFTKEEKAIIDNNAGKELYEIMDTENNILNIITRVLENNVKEDYTPVRNLPQKEKENLVQDLIIGALIYKKDGSIYYKQNLLKIRSQIRTLCILFMKNHKNFVDYSTIKDELIDAKKRPSTSFKTITKYVGELHKLLKKHFKRKVIFNQEKEGYIFDIERGS